MSRLSRECGSLDVSQPYGPSRPVAETALPLPYIKANKLICGSTAVSIRITVFCDVMPCGLVDGYQRLGRKLADSNVRI
jgi:hypothetical protein